MDDSLVRFGTVFFAVVIAADLVAALLFPTDPSRQLFAIGVAAAAALPLGYLFVYHGGYERLSTLLDR
ncbi:hypothetical protein [Halobellus clavatus]|jgi:hypothetical protein|uniref:Uncharacterized protein n=1 Tax=Halobellus clavatus TaxID=660517 RepID=A0A1H3E9Z7_9EURY|nr:hypothetical protein [Halobellus clavatus]SDX75511.1 hypothetical protein SAMN04487946_102134 [Halobellus clavatus]